MSVFDIGLRAATEAHLLHEQAFQLNFAVVQTLSISRVNHPDQCVGLLKVVLPVCAERLLATHVPLDWLDG